MRYFCGLHRPRSLLRFLVCFIFANLAFPVQAAELSRAAHVARHVTALERAGEQVPYLTKIAFARPVPEFVRRSNTVLARRWSMARARLNVEAEWLASCEVGACRDPRAATWLKTVSLVRTVPYLERPAFVQKLFSQRIRYVSDRPTDDHWAAPLSTLLNAAGDCEDHVLLKRSILISAGYRHSDLRLLILETASGAGHMVLEVGGQHTLVLDNRYRYPMNELSLTGDKLAAIATDRGFFLAR